MTLANTPIENLTVASGCRSGLELCHLRLLSPPDPLTRLLMEADGVSEADLDALVRKVATALQCANSATPPIARPMAPASLGETAVLGEHR